MARLERICRILRDLGVFLLGVAAITATIDYLFIHPDPMRDMQRAMNKSIIESLQQNLSQPGTSSRGGTVNESLAAEEKKLKQIPCDDT